MLGGKTESRMQIRTLGSNSECHVSEQTAVWIYEFLRRDFNVDFSLFVDWFQAEREI